MSGTLSLPDLQSLAAKAAGQHGSQAEFARFVGWDKSHVTRLKQLGQLVMGEGGRVDFAASLRLIAEHADPARDAQREVAAARRPEMAKGGDAGGTATDDDDETEQGPKYSESRATKEFWAAKTAEVEYQRLVGELVRRVDVDKAVADAAAQFRQAIDNQPHRLADRLVGLELEEIRTLLREDGQQMLAELARGFAKRLQLTTAPEGPR